jgi:UDP:flavonoid glycosyltransferase YjiC (YdhE family)
MAKFLIGTVPVVGHINPGLPIARKLVERGHEVWWYTGARFRAKIEATGARYVPMQHASDFDAENLDVVFPGRKGLSGLAQFKWDIKHIFVDSAIGQKHDLTAILESFPADVLLGDTAFSGGAFVHESGGPPWATFGISALTCNSRDTAPFGMGLPPSASFAGRLRNRILRLLFERVLFRDVTAHTNKVRASVGLAPSRASLLDAALSPFLYMHGSTPAFEYSRSDLPPQVHFIGPLLPPPPTNFTPPAWWDELGGDRRVVHVTQGTAATDADDLIEPTIRALADEDVLVVVTTGGKSVQSVTIDPLPSNVRIEAFIPHHYLLPHVDVMVTNGGYNGTLIALANGVPLVAAGQTEEKPEICTRIAWAGVGINLKTRTPKPEQVRKAVRTMLTDPRYSRKAQQIAADFARHDAPAEAAQLLEQLALTKQPVLRRGVAQPRELVHSV